MLMAEFQIPRTNNIFRRRVLIAFYLESLLNNPPKWLPLNIHDKEARYRESAAESENLTP
jgi:hypothetical protein